MKSTRRLAIDGGAPVRDVKQRPWPSWPIFDAAEEEALLNVVRSGKWWYMEGENGCAIEREFAAFQGARFGVACTNGSAALEIALRALQIGCGDEVIVPPYTFIATATSVLASGAAPVFADIDLNTFNLDAAAVEQSITPRTRAIIPVHIGGRPADMDAILETARRHNLLVLEDAAQAHGSRWRGEGVGSLGSAGTFSFQASKNLNSGEGGMVLTNDEQVAEAAWSVMNVGRTPGGGWYEHHVLGSNYRMTEFQAAVLRTQLLRLPEQMERRARTAAYLHAHLPLIPGICLPIQDERITRHANHLLPFRYDSSAFGGKTRDEFVKAMNAEGIPCSSGYVPLYRERVFARRAGRSDKLCQAAPRIDYPGLRLPACERACAEAVWVFQQTLLDDGQGKCDIVSAIGEIQSAWSA